MAPRWETARVRSILHIDMNAFYVSVELLRRPELRGKPVVVGGTGGRGVVAAASYEARRWGVRSAMPSVTARRLCPDVVFLSPDMSHYLEVSERLHGIFCEFTPLVEQISVDEAFLDVTGARRLLGSAGEIAANLRASVRERTGLPCSVGIAANKFIAKMASEFAKPRATPQGIEEGPGVHAVPAGSEREFLAPLPVQLLWGVGPATLDKLAAIGVSTIADLAEIGVDVLCAALGESHGRHLHRLSLGIDDREVETDRIAKSIGHEETFGRDLLDASDIRRQVVRLCDAVARRVRAADVAAGTVMLKVKYANFDTITRSVTPDIPLTTGPSMVAALEPVLTSLDPGPGIRLLGVHAQRLGDPRSVAPMLFGSELLGQGGDDPAETEEQWQPAARAVDSITERFGPGSIVPASTLDDPTAPGENPFGPGAQD